MSLVVQHLLGEITDIYISDIEPKYISTALSVSTLERLQVIAKEIAYHYLLFCY